MPSLGEGVTVNKVIGSLYERNNKYQMMIHYYDASGKRKSHSKSTGLDYKRCNKKQANQMLEELLNEYRNAYNIETVSNLYFEEYLEKWMCQIKKEVRENTLYTYQLQMDNHILPYFKKKHILLKDLRHRDLQAYYRHEMDNGMSPNTIKKYHANIHRALKYAVRDELIPTNPADSIDLPKVTKYRAGFYSIEEAEELFAAVKGTKMEAPIKLATIFGLRREEVLGLKWSAVDLKEQKLTIDHTCILIGAKIKNVDATKNESSHRMLYLTDDMTSFLKSLKIRQRESKLRYGEDYVDSGYVCVDEYGQQLKPSYISQTFKVVLKKNGLRHIRFHDLRHTCASLLMSQGYQLKDVQEWLGHSNISTTADIYGHLDDERKKNIARQMNGILAV